MIVHEKFISISGEIGGFPQGQVCAFIRLAGCNLKCAWCDTPDTQSVDAGLSVLISELIQWVDQSKVGYVVITGGEPLLQMSELQVLVQSLLGIGRQVSIETNGSQVLPLWAMRAGLTWVVDYKLPSSGMCEKMLDPREMALSFPQGTIIKFPCLNFNDFKVAKEIVDEFEYFSKGRWIYAFSPVNPKGEWAGLLVNHVLKLAVSGAGIPLVFSLQIHKFLGAQ